jgi:hypothetical protein
MATFTWTGGSGDFNTGSFWSGGTVPSAADVAVIGPGSGAVAITLDGTDTVGGLTLDDPGATLTVSGFLDLGSQTLDAAAGTLVVTGALADGTLAQNGATIVVYGPNADFDYLTVEGTLDLSTTATMLDVVGLAQPELQAIDLDANSQIVFLDSEDLLDDTVNLGGGVLATDDNGSNTGQLFIEAGTTILQDTADTTARMGPDTATGLLALGQVINQGLIEALAGTLDLDVEGGAFDSPIGAGPFVNEGTVVIGAGATVVDDSGGNLAQLGLIINSGGLLDLRGTLDNANTTIDVGTTGEFSNLQLDNMIIGGAIDQAGGTLVANNAYWQGVTVDGTGLQFTYLRLGANTALNPGGAPFTLTAVSSDYAQLDLGNNEVLANAIVNIGTSTDHAIISADYNGTSTLAATTTINVGSGQLLSFLSPGSLVNDAVINVASGGLLEFDNVAAYTSNGTINVAPGASILFNGTFGLNALGTVVGSGAKLVNLQTLDLDGSTVSTAGDANFSSFVNEGEVTDGTLITVAGQNPDLGIIDDGTLVTGPGVLPVSMASLGDATLQGAVQLTTDGVLDVTGNLRLENADGTGPGTLILDQQPKVFVLGVATSVQFLQSLTLSNAVVLLSGVTPATESAAFNSQSDLEVQGYYTVTLAPNVEIVDTTVNGPIGIMGGPGFYVNQGLIAVTPGADLVLGPYGSATQQDFINQGLITIAPGATLDVATQASILSLGSIVGPGGLLRLDTPDIGPAVYDNTANTITVGGPSGAPNLELVDAAITGGTIVNAGGEFTAIGGALNTVTYVGRLDLTSGTDQYGNTAPGFLVFHGGTLDSQSVTIAAGAELVLGAPEDFVGATLSLAGELADVGNTLSFDSTTVVTIDGNVYMPVGHLLNAGTIIIGPGGSLDLNDAGATPGPETSEPGTIVIDDGMFSAGVLNAGQTLDLGPDSTFSATRFDPGSDIIFQAPNTLTLANGSTFEAGASVAGFGVGDTIALTGYQDGSIASIVFGNDGITHYPNPAITFGYDGNTLSVIQSGTATIQTIPIGPGYDVTGFTATDLGSAPFLVTGYDITYTPPGGPAPSGPSIAGTEADQPTTDLAAVDPFSTVVITDPNSGATDTAIVTLTGTVDVAGTDEIGASATGTLSNLGIGQLIDGGEGYLVSGSAAAVQAALRGLVFTPVAHQATPGLPVTTSFAISLIDQVASVTDATTSVVATAVEDPIQLSGVIPVQYTSNNVNAAQPFADVTITDPDNVTFTATATLASTEFASFGDSFGATITNGVWNASGSLATITTALHNLIAYVTEPPLPTGQSVSTTIAMAISDGISQSVTAVSTIDIVSSSTADSGGLQIFGATPGQATSDHSPIAAFANVAVTDSQVGALDTVTVTMSNQADGTFSDPLGGAINAGTFTVSATPVASDFGFVSGIYDVLDGLIFTPTPGQVPLGQSVTTDFTIVASNDLGSVTDASTSVIATATGGQLAIDGAQANQEFIDDTTVQPLATVTVIDTQPTPIDTATVTLSNPSIGTLTAGNGGTVGVDGVFRFTGPLAQVQAALQAVGFTPAAEAAGQIAMSDVAINVTDGALNATDSTTSLDVIGSGTNGAGGTTGSGAPSISGTAADQATTDEAAIAPFSAVGISDPGIGQTETVTVSLSASANGVLADLGTGSYDAATGVYSVIGSAAQVTAAVDALEFTPTEHQVAPGDTVTTDFTIAVTDTADATASDSTTSVVATAVNDPPAISHTVIALGVPDEASDTPFAGLIVTDLDVGHIDTVSAALASPAAGTLSNLSGGSFDAATGVYTVSGRPAEVTTALDALVFTPVAPASGYLGTTGFTVGVTGPGGSDSNDTVSVTAVQQVLGLALVPFGNIAISVSPDGTGFATATPDDTNEAVVSDPAGATGYALPAGYQALYAGGGANVVLFDDGVGGAVLVGNTGNDTVIAGAANDSLVGGNGNNVLFGGTGQIALVAGSGNNLIGAPSGSTYAISVGGGNDTIYGNGSGTVTGGSGTSLLDVSGAGPSTSNLLISNGTADTVIGGAGATTVQALGSQTLIYGGTGGLTLETSGSFDTISASAATSVAATLSGSQALLFGALGATVITDQGTQDTVVGGAGALTVNGGVGASQLLVFGGGPLTFVGGTGAATVAGGSSAMVTGGSGGVTFAADAGSSDTVTAGSGGATLFGAANATVVIAGSASSVLAVAASGNETLNGASSGVGDLFWGGAGGDLLIGGSGNDTLAGGAGSTTLTGGAGDNFFFVTDGHAGGNDYITDFTAQDTVGLFGYGSAAAGTALQDASSSAGNVTLTLSDNTTITFLGVASSTELTGHVFSS